MRVATESSFGHSFSTGSWQMLIAALGASLIAVIAFTFAVLLVFYGRVGGGIFAGAVGVFNAVGAGKFLWDYLHPKQWELRLENGKLYWSTPTEQGQIGLNEVAGISIIDGEVPRLTIETTKGTKLQLHPNCLGNLRSLRSRIQEMFPRIQVEYVG